MENKNKWKAMTSLAAEIVGEGLTIFGSYVSTHIIHNDHAERFYEVADHDLYDDASCQPELSGRFVVPSDIDVICSKEQYKAMMEHMKGKYYIRHTKKMDMSYRAWMCGKGEYYLHTTDVICVVSDVYVRVSIDFVVQCKGGVLDLPNKVDSDVNGLLLSKNGLRIHQSVRDFYPRMISDTFLLIKVISKVLKRECTVRSAVQKAEEAWGVIPERRLQKLKDKGYALSIKYAQIHFIQEVYDGECLICLNPLPASNCKFSGCDCNYRFCVGCMGKTVEAETAPKCPLCRAEVNLDKASIDLAVFANLGIHTPGNVYKMSAKYLM